MMNLDDLKQIREACLKNAEDLLDAAKRLIEPYPYLAYNLGALALEEIGKIVILAVEASPTRPSDVERSLTKVREDHVKKLFWSLWGPSLGTERITREQIEEYRGLATRIHELRLAGLYVDWHEGKVSRPWETVTASEARQFMGLAEARLGLEKAFELRDLNESDRAIAQWFAEGARDEEKARLIFGRPALDKLQELREFLPWIRWLKEQFDEADREAQALLAKELARTDPGETERLDEKWKVRIRLFTRSHSVRQRELNWWNGTVSRYLKLYRGAKHDELLVEFLIPKAIPLEGLWWVAWGYSRRFVAALNIGSLGFFWWQVPTDVSKFYDRIEDIEAKCEVRAERKPRLELDWGHNVLDQKVLNKVAMAFGCLPGREDEARQLPFGHYITGIAFLGKNDVHLQLEPNAFFEFFMAFKTAARLYGDWDGKSPFLEAARAIFQRVLPGTHSWEEMMTIGEVMEGRQQPPKEITLTEAGGMKVCCDAYLLSAFAKTQGKKE